jgi:hypothetical protein
MEGDAMNTKMNSSAAAERSPLEAERTTPLEKGLRSLRGIRWLLAAGGLVSAVSVYRLVESQWAGMSVAGQFLTLALGALALYGSGDIVRNRIRLPHAGSALLFLFAVLVPVLAWGAAYLNLLGEPLGWLTFAASMSVLLLASAKVFRQTLRYPGTIYPTVFGALTLSLPLLPQVKGVFGFSSDVFYVLAAVLLGALFHGGSCHINRFLFHRDRRDGKDRPVHFLPFLVLVILFIAAMVVLDPRSTFIALPLTIIGVVLVRTGEEYYRALSRSLRTKPKSWPKRSAALLTIGFSMVLIAWPLSLLDTDLRCFVLASAAAAWLFLTWGVRYKSVLSHVGGVVIALVAYHFAPALTPEWAHRLAVSFGLITGIAARSPVVISFAHLGFQAGLFALSWVLRHKRLPDHMQCLHAILTVLHGFTLVAIALVDFHAAMVFLPGALVALMLGMVLTRRIELLLLGHWTVAATVLVTSAELTGAGSLVTGQTVQALGLSALALVLLSPAFENSIARGFRSSLVTTRDVLLIPPSLMAIFIGLHGVAFPGWSETVLAGAIFLAAGHRLSNGFLITTGIGAFSIGLHGLAMEHFGYPSAVFTLATYFLFVSSWILPRLAGAQGTLRSWGPASTLSMFFHGLTGGFLLLVALGNGTVTMEPLVLPLVGLALLDWGSLKRKTSWVTMGMGLLVLYVPFHLWTAGWIETFPIAWIVAAPILLLLAFASRWHESEIALESVKWVLAAWTITALILCLIFSGIASLYLALTLVAMGLIANGRSEFPVWSSYLVLVQLTFVLKGVTEGILPADFAALGISLLPLGALFTFVWLGLLHRTRHIQRMAPEVRAFVAGLEATIAFGYLAAFTTSSSFKTLENAALVGVALGFALYHGRRSWQAQAYSAAWTMQAWTGLAVLHGFTAGWLRLESGIAPYVLLAAGALEYGLSGLFDRHPRGRALAGPAHTMSQILPLVAGGLAFGRVFDGGSKATLLFKVLPVFLTSLFYLVVASRESARGRSSVLASSFLGLGLIAIAWAQGMGGEFYCLAPGFSLLALSYLLHDEMGPTWSRHTFAAGAAFIYATPVIALYDELTWAWQAVLLVMTIVFGAASFALRSRSLLTVSTAAMLIDLACFVILIRETEPMLLWVGGLGLGISLIALAAYLEYQREGLAQQIRIFGRELQAWY